MEIFPAINVANDRVRVRCVSYVDVSQFRQIFFISLARVHTRIIVVATRYD